MSANLPPQLNPQESISSPLDDDPATTDARDRRSLLPALAAQALVSGTGLLASMTVGGRFGSGSSVELGLYSSALSLLMILVAVFEALVTIPMTVYFHRQATPQQRLYSGQLLLWGACLAIGLPGLTLVAVAVAKSYPWLGNELSAVILVLLAIAPISLARVFSRRWLLTRLDTRPLARIDVVFVVLFALVAVFLLGTKRVTAINVLLGLGITNLAAVFVWWSCYRRRFTFSFQGWSARCRENVAYGRWVLGENVCSAATLYFCNWYLLLRIDEAAAGVFFACFSVVLLANPFLLGVSSVLAPRASLAFARSGYPALGRVLLRLGSLIVLVLIGFSLALWFWGDELTTLLFGQTYDGYFQGTPRGRNQVTGLLGLAMPLLGISYVAAFGLLAIHRPADNFLAALAGLIVLVTVSLTTSQPSLTTAAGSLVLAIGIAAMIRVVLLAVAWRGHWAWHQAPQANG